jgi:demethylmenaquinone methyltransferase/2-methoxy-6-polyprenyl-1,4-benzoquinol methylase
VRSRRAELVARKRAEFAALAPRYEAQIAAFTLGRVHELRRFVASAAVGQAEGPVLELCCGTGGVTIELAQRFDEVLGVDLSPDMLARARKLIQLREAANVKLIEGDVGTLLVRPRSLSAVVCSLGLHEMPRHMREGVLRRAFGWLAPGGKLVICDYAMPKNWLLARLMRWLGPVLIEEEFFFEYMAYPIADRLRAMGFEIERESLISHVTTARAQDPARWGNSRLSRFAWSVLEAVSRPLSCLCVVVARRPKDENVPALMAPATRNGRAPEPC